MTSAAVALSRHSSYDSIALPDRHYEALRYAMEGYQETQANVTRAIYRDNASKTPAGRAIQRLAELKYLTVERWQGIGANFLRGTNRGLAALTARGVDPSRLFVPERPVSPKDLSHHLLINETRLVLRELGFDDPTPCWRLRRKLAALHPPAIPDVLAFRKAADGTTAGALAVEVDMGTEPLKVFVPKIALLQGVLRSWAAAAPAAILVLTVGPRRILAMEKGIAALSGALPVVVLPQPKQHGRVRVDALVELLTRL